MRNSVIWLVVFGVNPEPGLTHHLLDVFLPLLGREGRVNGAGKRVTAAASLCEQLVIFPHLGRIAGDINIVLSFVGRVSLRSRLGYSEHANDHGNHQAKHDHDGYPNHEFAHLSVSTYTLRWVFLRFLFQ